MTTKQSQPAIAVTGLRKRHPKSGYGLWFFALDEGPNCGGAILSHNDGVQGSGALMISTPDGSRTLEASLTVGDAAADPAEAFQKAQQRPFNLVFCGGQAGLADGA